jgi:RES domain-containing protein
MNSKMSPEQAWVHVKALWPEAKYIRRSCDKIHADGVKMSWDQCLGDFVRLDYVDIDWPEGMDRYPPELKEEWRDAAWPDDWSKPCRIAHCNDDGTVWVLIGRHTEARDNCFIVQNQHGGRMNATICQVRVTDPQKT